MWLFGGISGIWPIILSIQSSQNLRTAEATFKDKVVRSSNIPKVANIHQKVCKHSTDNRKILRETPCTDLNMLAFYSYNLYNLKTEIECVSFRQCILNLLNSQKFAIKQKRLCTLTRIIHLVDVPNKKKKKIGYWHINGEI